MDSDRLPAQNNAGQDEIEHHARENTDAMGLRMGGVYKFTDNRMDGDPVGASTGMMHRLGWTEMTLLYF